MATTRVPTSSKPLARPQYADSTRMSSGRSRGVVARDAGDAIDEVPRSDGITTLKENVLFVGSRGCMNRLLENLWSLGTVHRKPTPPRKNRWARPTRCRPED